MTGHFLKRLSWIVIGAVICTVVFSAVYNQPIRFRPKMTIYAHSVYTTHPSGNLPDQIMLSPSEDPATAVGLSWRASENIKSGQVRYVETGRASGGPYALEEAALKTIEAPELREDQVTHAFQATLKNLKPGTSYTYQVGDPSTGTWAEPRSFTTASKDGNGFRFVYFGDTQQSPGDFGHLLKDVNSRYPETALYMIAGDMVQDGDWRYMWDSFAAAVSEVFSTRPVAVALGNHDYRQRKGRGLEYFQGLFNLPDNGPAGQPGGGSYSFQYENIYFIVLDSNQKAAKQTKWLESQLEKAAEADFRVMMFHHPPYGLKRGRSGPDIVRHWAPLFDKYRVDLVLNGHDHSYRRTKKISRNRIADDDDPGVTYVLAASCEKFYKVEPSEYTGKQIADAATYQVITLEYDQAGKPFLDFSAYDARHHLVDTFIVRKRL